MRSLIRKLGSDESGQILSQVIKIGVAVVIIGLILAEVGPLLWFKLSTRQDAEDLASSAASEYSQDPDIERILRVMAEKLRVMDYNEEEIAECVIQFLPADSDNKDTVRVTTVKYANTLIMKHIGSLKKYTRISSTKEAKLVPSDKR